MSGNDELKVKGANFLSVMAALKTLRGETAVTAVTNGMLTPGGEALRLGTLLASGWYPASWYRDLLDAIRGLPAGGDALVVAVSKEGIRRDVGGIYKLVFKLMSPQTLLTQSSKALRMYYDRGECQILESRDGFVRASYRGFVGFNRVMWLDTRAASELLLELSGAKGLHLRVVSGGGDGDAHMDVEASWMVR
ncbi:MAG: hypothetical protein AB2A00_02285 [Myxococcota bacterium]